VTRVLLIVGASLLAVLLLAELAVAPIVARRAETELRRCADVGSVSVEGLRRPAVPALVAGRLREVDVVVTGLRIADLRVDEARTQLPAIVLPWSSAVPERVEGELEVVVTEADAEAFAAARTPPGVTPTVEFEPGAVALGVSPIPARVRVGLEVREGQLVLVPSGPLPSWFDALDVDLRIPLPGERTIERLTIAEGRVEATLSYVIEPAGERQLSCPELLR
jgi:hypothetical protein